jgi:hypothetical protein
VEIVLTELFERLLTGLTTTTVRLPALEETQGLAETGFGPLPTNGQLHISMLDDQRARISWLRLTIPEDLLPGSRPLSKYSLETNKLHDGAKALYWASAIGLRQTVSLL